MNFDWLSFLVVVLWLSVNLRNLLFYIYLWQLKEYRFDRVRAHLETKSGTKSFWGLPYLLKLVIFALFWLPVAGLSFFIKIGLLLVFLFDLFYPHRGGPRGKLPQPTLKPLLILVGSFFFQLFSKTALLYFIGPAQWLLSLVAVDLLLPAIVLSQVIIWSWPTLIFKRFIIFLARQKIKKLPDLLVVGITGSYGKTSTKELLKNLLKAKFKVLATGQHCNTDIGIARQILKKLNKNHQVYLVEMGAYRQGEIAAICRLVKPQIGILTGLNQQHLSLFGSFENLLRAKYELLESLPDTGFLVVNGDNPYCLQLAKKRKINHLAYSLSQQNGSLWAQEITLFKDRLTFKLRSRQLNQPVSSRLLGVHNLANLLAASAVSLHLGLNPAEIAESIKKIPPLPDTLSLFLSSRKAFLVDATYNSNPHGVLAAFNYLGIYDQKKFLVFQPLIELGADAGRLNRLLVEKALKIFEAVFLTNDNFLEKKTLLSSPKLTVITSPQKTASHLEKILGKGDAVLFEGRESLRVFNILKKKPWHQ